jgi:hypothetical protein
MERENNLIYKYNTLRFKYKITTYVRIQNNFNFINILHSDIDFKLLLKT